MQPAEPNREQIELWNNVSGARWVAMQEETDAQLRVFGDAVLEALRLAPGSRVLDVGCGCGATTLDLSRVVGSEGEVVGLDVSAPMLARARERAAASETANVRFELGDAQRVALPSAHFDALFSRFGVMFFDDPRAAFANLASSQRPGAKLGFVCWRPLAENPFMYEALVAATSIIAAPPPTPPRAPGPFAFAEAKYVREILAGAGYVDIDVKERVLDVSIGTTNDLDEAARYMLGLGPAAVALRLAGADEETTERVRLAIRDRLSAYQDERGITMPARVWIVTALRA